MYGRATNVILKQREKNKLEELKDYIKFILNERGYL